MDNKTLEHLPNSEQCKILFEEYNSQVSAHTNYLIGIAILLASIIISTTLSNVAFTTKVIIGTLLIALIVSPPLLYMYARLQYYVRLIGILHILLGLYGDSNKEGLEQPMEALSQRMNLKVGEIGMSNLVMMEYNLQLFHDYLYHDPSESSSYSHKILLRILRFRKREPDDPRHKKLSTLGEWHKVWKEIRTQQWTNLWKENS